MDVKHGKTVSVLNVHKDISSTTMEFAVKLIKIVKSSIVMLEYANNATMASKSMLMELVKHGKTLIQLTMDVLNGLIINVKHVLLNTILTPITSVLQSVLNAVNGIPTTDNVLHATLDILLITEHVL